MRNIEQIKRAYVIAAKIVSEYGDTYLPVFERLHQEIKMLEAQNDLKSIAFQIGTSIPGA